MSRLACFRRGLLAEFGTAVKWEWLCQCEKGGKLEVGDVWLELWSSQLARLLAVDAAPGPTHFAFTNVCL